MVPFLHNNLLWTVVEFRDLLIVTICNSTQAKKLQMNSSPGKYWRNEAMQRIYEYPDRQVSELGGGPLTQFRIRIRKLL